VLFSGVRLEACEVARPRQRNEKHTGYGHCLPKRQLLDHLAFCAPETSNRSFQHVAKCGVMRLELKSGYEGPSDDWGIIITSAVLGMLTLTLIVALLVRWLNQRYPPRRIEVSADRPTSSLWLVPHNLETEEERMVRNAGPSARPCACPEMIQRDLLTLQHLAIPGHGTARAGARTERHCVCPGDSRASAAAASLGRGNSSR